MIKYVCDLCEKELYENADVTTIHSYFGASGHFCKTCSDEFSKWISSFKERNNMKIELECSYTTKNNKHLSVRAYNCLARARINTMDELVEYINSNGVGGIKGLLGIRNLGKRSIQEIYDYIDYKGFTDAIKEEYRKVDWSSANE